MRGQVFNVSSNGGCLRCGGPCLDAVTEALPGCLVPVLAAAGSVAGLPVPDLGIAGDGAGLISCVRGLVSSSSECRECVESLVCCVTDSCKLDMLES